MSRRLEWGGHYASCDEIPPPKCPIPSQACLGTALFMQIYHQGPLEGPGNKQNASKQHALVPNRCVFRCQTCTQGPRKVCMAAGLQGFQRPLQANLGRWAPNPKKWALPIGKLAQTHAFTSQCTYFSMPNLHPGPKKDAQGL